MLRLAKKAEELCLKVADTNESNAVARSTPSTGRSKKRPTAAKKNVLLCFCVSVYRLMCAQIVIQWNFGDVWELLESVPP